MRFLGMAFRTYFVLFLGIMIGGACVTCVGRSRDGFRLAGGGDEVVAAGADRVGVIEVFGPIDDAKDTVERIRSFARRDDLKALVLRVDSPGGSVAPSQEIYDALRYASSHKPVVASMGGVAASGGFWISLGADWIVASPGSITGSIGVISQTPDLRGLAELLKIRMRTFKSGPVKDAGNPFREMTPADKAVFMGLIGDIYAQFVGVTSERRKMPISAVKKVADGRIMTGRRALEVGLVDELGGLFSAARRAVYLAEERTGQVGTSTGTVDDPTLVYPREPGPDLFELLQASLAQSVRDGFGESLTALAAPVSSIELR